MNKVVQKQLGMMLSIRHSSTGGGSRHDVEDFAAGSRMVCAAATLGGNHNPRDAYPVGSAKPQPASRATSGDSKCF
jgi:hypothetical protein